MPEAIPARTGCAARKSGRTALVRTLPSISSGTGTPSKYSSVGARSMSCTLSISVALFSTSPRPIKIPLSRCVPPHSLSLDGRCSRIITAGLSLSLAKLGSAEKRLSSLHQSSTMSAASPENGPSKSSSRRWTRAITGLPVRGSLSSSSFSIMKSISCLYSVGSTIPAGLIPFRLIQILGGAASTSVQYALVRLQSMFTNEV